MLVTGSNSPLWLGLALAGLTLLAGYGGLLVLAATTGRGGRLVPGSLRSRLALGLALLAVVPALGITVSLTERQLQQQRERATARLATASVTLAAETDEFISKHVAGIRLAADALSRDAVRPIEQLRDRQLRFHAIFPGLLTTLVTDGAGRIVSATRMGDNGPLEAASTDRSVADREYFQAPMRDGQPFVSRVFRGRGLGTDPIVAISAPILQGETRVGVLEGSLNLRGFRQLEENHVSPGSGGQIVIVDDQWRVIYSSAATGLKFLEDLAQRAEIAPLRAARSSSAVRITLPSSSRGTQGWLAVRAVTQRGWHAIVMLPEDTIATQLTRDIRITLGWLAATLTCALLLAWGLARSTTGPLDRLQGAIRQFEVSAHHDELRRVRGLTDEYRSLFRSLHRLSWQLRGSYARLSSALTETTQLRNELSEVLARREEEVRQRTRELDAANRELERLSRLDALTGLANRRWFDEFVQQAWRVALREQVPISFILIDVDHFKAFNDRYGHPAGDACLKRVAEAVRRSAGRPLDHAARFGGEEFAVVLTDAVPEAAVDLAAGLRAAVASLDIRHEGSPLGHVTVSVGLATLVPGPEDTAAAALERADRALYAAKAAGRNQVFVWSGIGQAIAAGHQSPQSVGRRIEGA